VDLTLITTHAPAPSTAAPVHTLALLIGEIIAAAASVIALALDERANGGLRPRTKTCGGDLIAQLYALRSAWLSQAEPGWLNFDATAREYGKRAIAARYAAAKRELPDAPQAEPTDAMLDELVSWPLDILEQVVRSQLN
jgi:hypothetical protein